MGAILLGNKIFISKGLSDRLSDRERKVLLAHEISHYKNKDIVKMFFIKVLLFFLPSVINNIKRKIEIRADMDAIEKTKDVEAYKSLLNKLTRDGPGYPSKQVSLNRANVWQVQNE